MFAEIGAELARLEKARQVAQQKKALEEQIRVETEARKWRENLEILESAFCPIIASFNDVTERPLRLTLQNNPEALMISRSSGTIIWLRVAADELYYKAPAQIKRAVRYLFIIERDSAGDVIFYPDNLPSDRMNAATFAATVLKHSLGLLR